jgi:tRNA pseudouridine32 synthase/23S rRNA pseudouridine746 synthase
LRPLTTGDIAFVKSLVIYEDDELIAFNKPSGLSSQAGRTPGPTLDDLLVAFARASGNRPRLIHRLDRDTSGVILTARTKPAAGFLGKAMMARRIHKTYLALVSPGAPRPKQGAIDAFLRREEIGREAYSRVCEASHPDAEQARTLYRTIAEGEGAALLEMRPQTGRMHQIRVHLASIDRPIVGDVRYGGALMVAGEPAARLMLHAAVLEFPHPAGGSRRITAPLPDDFRDLATALGMDGNALPLAVISSP